MPAITEAYQATRARRHLACWVCAPEHEGGLGLRFTPDANGAVAAVFSCGEAFAGYPDHLHGGLAAALLDGAMTNCLMARGTPGLTARLEIRYREPIRANLPVTIRGWWEKSRGPLHVLGAEIRQNGRVRVTGAGRFMEYPEESPSTVRRER